MHVLLSIFHCSYHKNFKKYLSSACIPWLNGSHWTILIKNSYCDLPSMPYVNLILTKACSFTYNRAQSKMAFIAIWLKFQPSLLCGIFNFYWLVCVTGIVPEELGVKWHQPMLDLKVQALRMCFRFKWISIFLFLLLMIITNNVVSKLNMLFEWMKCSWSNQLVLNCMFYRAIDDL